MLVLESCEYKLQVNFHCRLKGDVPEICKKNALVATSVGRRDLVQTWSLLSQVLDRKLADTTNMDESPWALHPFGRALVQSL